MIEVYKTADNKVIKFVHTDGSETAIKLDNSCNNSTNNTGRRSRNKFSVFISVSSGCLVGCKFCYLEAKKFPYMKLSPGKVVSNVLKAIKLAVDMLPELKNKYARLSFMGMGDVLLYKPFVLEGIVESLVRHIVEDDICAGVDGIDIGTTLPVKHSNLSCILSTIQMRLSSEYQEFLNPAKNGSIVRVFYSLHSCFNRNSIIPKSAFLGQEAALKYLKGIEDVGIDIILHKILLKGITDSEDEIDELSRIINATKLKPEIRILRYNRCSGSIYSETEKFDEIVKRHSRVFDKVKYQISTGSEVKAACGQFICRSSSEPEK